MNAITAIEPLERAVALAIPDDIEFPQWVNLGRDLFTRHRQTEWMIADWINVGADKFRDEAQMTIFLDEIGVDQKRALADAKVARLIPATWRSDKVSFDVCKQIAKIDDEPTRQRMLKQAVDERWNEKQAHHHIIEHKYESGALFEDDDSTPRLATEIVRMWNRVPVEVREYVHPLIEAAAVNGFTPIDEDQAI